MARLTAVVKVAVIASLALTEATVQAETIHTTANHPWLTSDRGWVVAGDLREGEPVVTLNGAAVNRADRGV